jgi:hypothetical protein
MKNIFKSKLRKRIEFYIEMCEDSITALKSEIKSKKVVQTLNPSEYAKYVIKINALQDDIKLLKEILK